MPKCKKAIYLTFDDGPTPEITDWTLGILKNYNAKATFFCKGENAVQHPSILTKIAKDNHSIGNHTFSHLNGWKTNKIKYVDDVEKTANALSQHIDISKNKSLLFRPPYGKIKPNQANALIKKGYKIVMLDVVSGDFDQNLDSEKCLQKLLKNTKAGNIVVFHDNKKSYQTLQQVLPKALEYWKLEGYDFFPL
jgi:peptidoglycan/xylan/chitin deacetylase (PgdA/CDA1 family)